MLEPALEMWECLSRAPLAPQHLEDQSTDLFCVLAAPSFSSTKCSPLLTDVDLGSCLCKQSLGPQTHTMFAWVCDYSASCALDNFSDNIVQGGNGPEERLGLHWVESETLGLRFFYDSFSLS